MLNFSIPIQKPTGPQNSIHLNGIAWCTQMNGSLKWIADRSMHLSARVRSRNVTEVPARIRSSMIKRADWCTQMGNSICEICIDQWVTRFDYRRTLEIKFMYFQRNITLASEFCRKKGMDLATIESDADFNEIKSLIALNSIMSGTSEYWLNISAYNNNSYFWQSQLDSPSMAGLWTTVSAFSGDLCVTAKRTHHVYLSLQPCEWDAYFICEQNMPGKSRLKRWSLMCYL